MAQAPRPPFDGGEIRLEGVSLPASASRKKRGVFRSTFRGVKWLAEAPVQWIGLKSIRQGASFIGGLTDRARARPVRDSRFKTEDRGAFDLYATAFSMGLTVAQLERRLADRRRQTAMMAYLLGALGVLAFVAWFMKVVATPAVGARLVLAVDFLPLCVLFVLLAFYQSLVNYQVRVGRTAGWREYITTDQGFWPRS